LPGPSPACAPIGDHERQGLIVKKLGTWIALAFAGAALVVILVTIAGFFRSPQLTARVSVEIARPPAEVWDFLSNLENLPKWSSEVTNVEKISDHPLRYRLTGSGGAAEIDVVAFEPPRRYVTRMSQTRMGASGQWEILVEPAPAGARVSSNMTMRLDNPLLRGLSLFFNPESAERSTLQDLKRHLELRAR
jgi:uncharacterized membrane protein